MRPTIPQLEAFLAVARTLNFRRAADETFTSQSAISAHVKRLEELLGVELFERNRRRTLLTKAGERAQGLAQDLLQQLDQFVESLTDQGDPLAGTMRIGAIPTIAPFVIPRFVSRVAKEHPATKLLVYEETTPQLVARLQAGEVDAILVDVDVDLANSHSEVLFEEALVLTVSEQHPMAQRKSVSLEEVAELDLLLLEEGHCLSDRIRTFCQASESSVHGDFRATSLVTLVHMVAVGTGVTLLPQMAVRDLGRIGGLRLVPFSDPAPTRRIGIAWRPTDRRDRTFRRLGELVESSSSPS